MNLNNETSLKVAEYLLQIKAIKLDLAKPFTWASGIKSPIYCDNRKTLSYPIIRTYIRQEFVKLIEETYGVPNVIAGVATGGIPHGILVAQELGIPFVYVRAEEKQHGLENKIEGVIEAGQSVVIVEDLISTGGSSLKVHEALKASGCNVKGMVAIFTYQLKQAVDNFKKAKCKLVTLSNYDDLIKQAIIMGYVADADLSRLSSWKSNPEEWK